MKLSVVIPVYNEVHTLREIIDRVRAVNVPKEIILVDDYSTDGTRKLYPELEPLVDRIILHEVNQGKGAALRTGFKHATGDFVIVQDADLEYDPEEYHILLQPMLEGKSDVVYGSRFLGGRPHRVLYYWHSLGNNFLTMLSNMFTNLNLTDMETCYKMFKREIIQAVQIEQNRFGFEPEITAKIARMKNIRIFEVGISYDGRSYSEGKKIGWKDGVNAIYCILKYSRGRYQDYGKQTLQALETFDAYAQWMYEKIRPHIGRRVMEIGSGIGNNVKSLKSHPDTEVILTEYRDDYVEELRRKHGAEPNVSIYQYDATKPPPPALKANPPDTIICLNVLEHIPEERLALKNMFDLLAPGGKLVVLVPAHQALYCKLDENLEHCQRYSRDELQKKFRDAGFQISDSFHFNPVGALGWLVAGKVLRAQRIRETHVSGQKVLMPVARAIDRLNLPLGLSVVCVGQKPPVAAAPGVVAAGPSVPAATNEVTYNQ